MLLNLGIVVVIGGACWAADRYLELDVWPRRFVRYGVPGLVILFLCAAAARCG